MKIQTVSYNNRKKTFCIKARGKEWCLPYAKADLQPTAADPIEKIYVDRELAREGFTYVLKSGKEDSVLSEQFLHYNRDPDYMRDMMLYRLSLEAQKRVAASGLAKREIIRRLGTSATQLYRLLDQTNYRKSIDQMLALLQVLDCEVELTVRPKHVARNRAA
jgi:hypothetical protein